MNPYKYIALAFALTPSAAFAEGSTRDLGLAKSAVQTAREFLAFQSFYAGQEPACSLAALTAEKISYANGNHGDNEMILVTQKALCPGVNGRPANKPAIVFSVELWRANAAGVRPDSPFTVVQSVKMLLQAN